MESEIKTYIRIAIQSLVKERNAVLENEVEFDLTISKDAVHGDYATNAAFKLAKILRMKPALIADDLIRLMGEQSKIFSKMEVAGGGFVNFFVNQNAIVDKLYTIIKLDRQYGESDFGKKRKVVVEFVSANPTGPLTIAHGRQAAIGDSLVRILKKTGHEVSAEYYLNDAGRQMKLLGESVWSRYCENFEIAEPFPEEGYRGDYIKDLAAKLVEIHKDGLLKEDRLKAVETCRIFAKDQMMESIRKDLKELGVHFDTYFSETTLYKKKEIEKALERLKSGGFLYEEEGALWFKSTHFGDDKDRVVRKSSGEYTYLLPDIAYHKNKFDRGYEILIDLLGPDHHGYVSRLKASCQALGHLAEAIDVLIVQLTTLYRDGAPVRMSTRAGEFVTLKELKDEVGADAVRFFFVMRRVETPLDFDLELAKRKSDENPVFYLQYAHARIASIIRFSEQSIPAQADLARLNQPEELDLIKLILDFPKTLMTAAAHREPYRLVDYLRDLAALFHKFYAHHRVVSDDADLTKARLILVEASRITFRNGLELLGISQPESM